MNELQRQLNELYRQLGDAEQSGQPVVDIQRKINAVHDAINEQRDQRAQQQQARWSAHWANLSDCWLAIDVSFSDWKAQRVVA